MPLFLHRLLLRLRFLRNQPYCRALIAWEEIFAELLREFVAESRGNLQIDMRWDPREEQFDAYATSDPAHRVRIGLGCFGSLQGIMNTIFGSTDRFRWIGDPSHEIGDFATRFTNEDQSDAPIDAVRREASFIATEIGIALVVLHEIGHITLGHTRVSRDVLPLRRFRQASRPDERWSMEVADRYQACELGSDRFAFQRVLRLAAIGRSPFASQLVSESVREHLFDLAMIAFAIVIALLHRKEAAFEDYAKLAHPHPAVRFLAAEIDLLEYLPQSDVVRLHVRTMRECCEILSHGKEQNEMLALISTHRVQLTDRIAHLRKVGDALLAKCRAHTA